MILWEAVQYFYFDEVGRAVGFRSVVEDLVRLQLISGDVLGVKLVVDKPIDDLSFADEAWAKDANPSCLYRLVSALCILFLFHFLLNRFLVVVIIYLLIILENHGAEASVEHATALVKFLGKCHVD
jgi:VIT1/CCC1 family predicted Fe2+/Mn2+ transporter